MSSPLESELRRIDRRGYRAYKDIAGAYDLGEVQLFIDHVQGDPFAAPSKLRLRVDTQRAGVDPALFANRVRRVAFEDFLARVARTVIHDVCRGRRGSGKSGAVGIDAGGQEVLERTAACVTDDFVELRITAGLPAAGRSVLAREAIALLLDDLPAVARLSLFADEYGAYDAERFVDTVEDQAHLRGQLAERGLVAFVADGAILPRASGASDRPLSGPDVVPFVAPESLAVELEGLHPPGPVRGLGVPRGVTLIVGGGYHGKSTLLSAIQRGVYDHVPDDGRERVVTDHDAVKIRAEDGRHISSVDISPFIGALPGGRTTTAFSTDDASGSTSQAASIVEAIEVGATTLLLDEDTSATNFMVRDARMQALVHADREPITPFVDRVRELYETLGVSTVLVMGGSGDYFDQANTVVQMDAYRPKDVTAEAHAIAEAHPTGRRRENDAPLVAPRRRGIERRTINAARGKRDVKIDVRAVDRLTFGTTEIDLGGVEQLVDTSQTRAVGYALEDLRRDLEDDALAEALTRQQARFDADGLDGLDPFVRAGRHPGHFARPRRFEIAAAINRLRSARLVSVGGDEETD
ncbi:MAG: ABC-ATPase domain-containing protein [Deltaproteobacteria bacterium]